METVPAISVNPSLTDRLNSLDRGQRLRLGLGLALFVAIAIIGLVMGRQTEWRVLYANLGDKDGGAIIAQLTQMNVPYKHSEGGVAILVPADRVHDTRLRLASQGLPKGAVAGFEQMESNRFGMTQFQERLTFQRGLEGELTRSIQALASVQSARVHLALPNQNGFFREQQKPSASVLVSLHAGRTLDRAQLAGIVHLVASSVPEMSTTAVSVLDDTGKLLSGPVDGRDGIAGGADAQQLQYVQHLEQLYSRRILEILEPVVGRQNVKAQVTAEVDFSQTEQTSELHKPNQTPDTGAVRSQQTLESTNGVSSPPTGVPGATTNQPPGPSSAPINGPGQTPAPQAGGASGGAGNTASKRESIINYEVDKTIKVVRGGTGVVKRLSAAVVLNHQPGQDDKGNVIQVPLTDAQIEKMTALVRETIGFNQERGDSVNLLNAPFSKDTGPSLEIPFWKDPQVLEMARGFAWPLGTVILGTLILLLLVRPTVKSMNEQAVIAEQRLAALEAVVDDEQERPALLGPDGLPVPPAPTPGELALEEARKLTRDNPAAVAAIVRAWMSGEAPA
jgi:flagellar M-ring protein FliF